MHQLESEGENKKIKTPSFTCSTLAVANYIIKYMHEKQLSISKTKLQNILVYAHIEYIRKHNKALIAEPMRLTHFGFLFKSIYDLFADLKYDDNINKQAYILAETQNNINARQYAIDKDIGDALQVLKIKKFLNKILKLFADKDIKQAININIAPGTVWHYVAFVKLQGNHLIKDFIKISNKSIAKALKCIKLQA